jgi:hypothetical protein
MYLLNISKANYKISTSKDGNRQTHTVYINKDKRQNKVCESVSLFSASQ